MYYEINSSILPQIRLVNTVVLEPPYVHKRRQTDEYVLYIMKKGSLHLQENGIDYELKAGDVLLLDLDFVHQGTKASYCEYIYIHFRHPEIYRKNEDAGFIESCLKIRSESLQEDSVSYGIYKESFIQFPKYINLQTGNSYLMVAKLIQEAVEQNRNQMEGYKVLCACKIMESFVEIAREAVSSKVFKQIPRIPQSYNNIHELLNFLNANYNKDISGDMIEEIFSCNFDYLNRVFKENIGKTIFVYLNEIRIHHAKEMIATTSMKIMAIGYRVGFRDECYFSKVFKKYTGMSPRQYEKLTSQVEVEKSV